MKDHTVNIDVSLNLSGVKADGFVQYQRSYSQDRQVESEVEPTERSGFGSHVSNQDEIWDAIDEWARDDSNIPEGPDDVDLAVLVTHANGEYQVTRAPDKFLWAVVCRDDYEARTRVVKVHAADEDEAFRIAGKDLYDNESGAWSLLVAFPNPQGEHAFPSDTGNAECSVEDYPGVRPETDED